MPLRNSSGAKFDGFVKRFMTRLALKIASCLRALARVHET